MNSDEPEILLLTPIYPPPRSPTFNNNIIQSMKNKNSIDAGVIQEKPEIKEPVKTTDEPYSSCCNFLFTYKFFVVSINPNLNE